MSAIEVCGCGHKQLLNEDSSVCLRCGKEFRNNNAVEVLKQMKQSNYLTGVQLPAFSQEEANKKRVQAMRDRDNALGEALLALEQKERLLKICDELEANQTSEIGKTLFGALIGTCKVREVLGLIK